MTSQICFYCIKAPPGNTQVKWNDGRCCLSVAQCQLWPAIAVIVDIWHLNRQEQTSYEGLHHQYMYWIVEQYFPMGNCSWRFRRVYTSASVHSMYSFSECKSSRPLYLISMMQLPASQLSAV